MEAQSEVTLEVNFKSKIGNKITLFRFRERSQIAIISAAKETFMAKLICRIDRDGQVLYQTGTHNAPIIRISEGDNLFEGDVVIPTEEINKLLLFDSTIRISYDLFYLERMSTLKQVGLSFSVSLDSNGQVIFDRHDVAHKNISPPFSDFKCLLAEKINRSKVSSIQHISETVVGFMQIQQAIALAFEGYKFKREEGN